MNSRTPSHRRALAASLLASALLATPALAQEAASAPQQATPTPVTPTIAAPPAPTPTPAPVQAAPAQVAPADASAQDAPRAQSGIGDANSATPINQAALEQAEAERAERRSEPRAAARPAVRSTPRGQPAAARAPVAAPAPAATSTPAPTPSATPTDDAGADALGNQAAAPAPGFGNDTAPAGDATVANDTAATTDTATNSGGAPIWPWVLAALVVIGGLAFFLLRRRDRDEVEHVPEYFAEPAPTTEPVAQTAAVPAELADERPLSTPTPVAATALSAASLAGEGTAEIVTPDDVSVADADDADVAALTAAAPVDNRAWLEFALRPVRAGVSGDDALLEVELTVGNAGSVDAEDVRIATYLLESADAGEVDQLLAEPPAEGAVEPVTIAAGEGTRVDATLSLATARLTRSELKPVFVADVRYRSADGGEGRTSAAFFIGLADADGTVHAMPLAATGLREDVGAELVEAPRRS